MAEITTVGGRPVIDYTARDYDSLLRSMRELIPAKLPEWKNAASESDFGTVLLELFAHMGDILSYYQDRIANESFLSTAQTRRSVIEHLRLIGYRLATAAPASAVLTLYVPASFNGKLELPRGSAFATKSRTDAPPVRFEYTGDVDPLVIDCGALPHDPASGKKYYFGIPVEEGRTINAELLGTSDGSPNQRFTLARPGLILGTDAGVSSRNRDLLVVIDNEEWALRETLAFSREKQKEYAIEIDDSDRATVIFGDGRFGAAPPGGAAIVATYRVGGGRAGNVPQGAIGTILDAPVLTKVNATVTNTAAATGGADREEIDHAVLQAPAVFRSLRRAVTADDYAALALRMRGVGKVRAEATSWNTVTLFVAPEGGGRASDVLKKSLLAYFEDKRPATVSIEIDDVDYVDVYVTARISVNRYADEEIVTRQVREAAGSLVRFDNVDFGRTLYISKFYEAIEAIADVNFVNITEFARRPAPPAGDTPFGLIKLAYSEIARIPADAAYAQGINVLRYEDA